jgi:very-short-patch-repair endonuclease
MLITERINYRINNKSEIYFYNKLGYKITKVGEEFILDIKDLPLSNNSLILVRCDVCGNEKQISYKRYNITTTKNTSDYCCSQKCSRNKCKKTVINKYGVENISQLGKIKEKKIETCKKNFGVDYPQQSKEVFEKSKSKKLEKYGEEFYFDKEKMIKTKLENNKQMYFNTDFYKNNSILDYKGNGLFTFICNEGHEYVINYQLLKLRHKKNSTICTICNPLHSYSGMELVVLDLIKNNYSGEIITNSKLIINPLELDIYLPELKLAIEFNGLYWHSELYKEKNYHLEKTNACNNLGIQLIHIWEDDWLYKQDIVISMILYKLNKSNKIFARKCQIKEIKDNKEIRKFLEQNHIQGFVGSTIKLGLYYNNELVSLMTFGNLRKFMNSKSQEGYYELLRFCNKINYTVIGGADKLFKYFLTKFNPIDVISYSDYSRSIGNMYRKLGFELSHLSQPNYYYIIDNKRIYRYNFRKDKLVKEGFDPNKTEVEIMHDRKYY